MKWFLGSASYFKSDPSPVDRAIQESLLGPLFKYGIKTTPILDWDGKPESLIERKFSIRSFRIRTSYVRTN